MIIRKGDSNTCNRCGEFVKMDHKRGRLICQSCGLLKEARFVDLSSEYRYFIENTNVGNDPRRGGNPVNTHLDSQIDLIEIDDGQKSYHIFAAQSNSDKLNQRGTKLIKRFCDILDIRTSIIKQVEEIFFEVQDKKELRGKRLENIIAACIYLACKRNLVNIQPTALEPLANVSQNKILKTAKIILQFIPKITIHSSEYAKLFAQKLQIKNEHIKDIIAICIDIEQWDFFNKQLPKPRTIAAAVIYFYLSKLDPKFKKPLNEIKDAAGICTDNTVKKYFKDLEEKKEHINKVIGKDLDLYNGEEESENNQQLIEINQVCN